MNEKLTHFEVEDLVDVDCERDAWRHTRNGCVGGGTILRHVSVGDEVHRLLAHIEAQDQEITDLRTEMAVMRTERDMHRKAYWGYEPRPKPTNPTKETTCQE